MNKPKTLYRPSDNAQFVLGENGSYSHAGHVKAGHGSYVHSLKHLKRLGFRETEFTEDEMYWHDAAQIPCKLDGVAHTLHIPRSALEKLL